MPYVTRDKNNRIIGISDRQSSDAQELLPNTDPEVMQYLRDAGPDSMRDHLSRTDLDMSRITEDLIEVLIQRNVLNFTDFPLKAQKKLMARQKLRSNLSSLTNLVQDDDDVI